MSGKLIKPQYRILWLFAMLNIFMGGFTISAFLDNNVWYYLASGIFGVLVGLFCLVVYWYINHPKLPKWAEDYFTTGIGIHEVGDKGE